MSQPDLSTIPGVQREILAVFRRGSVLVNCHKEGITRVLFERDRFVRTNEGDWSGREEWTDEAAFLAALWTSYRWRATDGAGPGQISDLEAWRRILRYIEETAEKKSWLPGRSSSPPLATPPRPVRSGLPRLGTVPALILVGVFILGAATLSMLSKLFTVRTSGSPLGEAVGTPEFIAQLIVTQRPYVPSLHRNAANDRYRIDLLVLPRDGRGKRRLIPLRDRLDASSTQHGAKLLGSDGRFLWILAGEITAYDHKANRLVRLEELRRANPSLEALWPEGFYEVNGRLQVSTRDNRVFVEVDPDTLVAAPPTGRRAPRRPFPPHPVDSLLLSAPAPGTDALKPAWVLGSVDAPKLALTEPDSSLLVFWRKFGVLERMLYARRVDTDGNTLWETETGIDSLQQVLPDRSFPAFIGTRPRVPDKVSEPILVILDAETDKATTHSLWIGK